MTSAEENALVAALDLNHGLLRGYINGLLPGERCRLIKACDLIIVACQKANEEDAAVERS